MSERRYFRAAGRALGLALCVAATCAPAALAQGTWAAQLAISPYPSPYLSDWEANPSIGTLTITNSSSADQQVLVAYRVTDQRGRLLASGRSDPQLVPRGAPTVISDIVHVSGTSQHDQALEDQMRRTGRLPEGDNPTCVAVTDTGGFVLAEDCSTFSIVYPDPPYLIGPLDDAALASGSPVFQWTPLQVPPAFRLTYVLRLSEVLAGQSPLQALAANIPIFETTTFATNLEYPVGAQPLVEGKTYAWRVQALDQNGYPASASEGRSETWTFRYDVESVVSAPAAAMSFGVFNAYETRDNPAAPAAPTQYGVGEICSHWTSQAPDGLDIGVNSPFGFVGFQTDIGFMHRQVDPAHPDRPGKWWVGGIVNADRGRAVVMHGDCQSPTPALSGFQWIASGAVGAQPLNEWVNGNGLSRVVDSIQFGVWIVALHGGTVAGDTAFPFLRQFLGDRSIEVKRGLNAYAEINLRRSPAHDFFTSIGYAQPTITLQGFVGLDVERAVGVGHGGDGYEAAVSQQRSFLLLSAELPHRTPVGVLHHLVKSMWVSFEFEIQDSSGVNVAYDTAASSHANRSIDFVFRIKHTMQLQDSLFRTPGERALVGWIGADRELKTEQQTRDVAQRRLDQLNRAGGWLSGGRAGNGAVANYFGVMNATCSPRPGRESGTDLVISYGLEGELYIGSLFLKDPNVEVHVGGRAPNGERDLSVGIVSNIGIEGFSQQGILGLSRVREYQATTGLPNEPACQSNQGGQPIATRPRSESNADQTARPTTPQGALSTPWRTDWKIAWDIVPAAGLSGVANGVLGGLFAFLGAFGGM